MWLEREEHEHQRLLLSLHREGFLSRSWLTESWQLRALFLFFFIKGKKYIDKKCLQDKLAVQARNQQYKWIYIQAKGTDSLEQTIARQACSTKSVTTQREQTPSYDKPKGTDSLEYKKIYMNMDSPHVGKVEISKLHSAAAQALLLQVRRTSSSRQGAA